MGRKNSSWTAQKPILFISTSINGVTKPNKIKDIKKAPLFMRIKIDKKNKNVNVKLFLGNIAKKRPKATAWAISPGWAFALMALKNEVTYFIIEIRF